MKVVVCLVFNDFKNDSRVLKVCNSLAKNGFTVTVLAIRGEGLPSIECVGHQIQVVRLPVGAPGSGKFRKILSYIHYTLRSISYLKSGDIVHCNDLETLPAGLVAKLVTLFRAKIIYDAHELETERKYGLNRAIYWAIRFVELALIRFADKVITVSPSIANHYAQRYGLETPALVLNCPEYKDMRKTNVLRTNLGISGDDNRIFLYQGAFVKGRGIELLITAFSELQNTGALLVFMGYGPLESQIKRAVDEVENIYYHPAVPPQELGHVTSSADVGICLIENKSLSYYYCLPNKFFEYLSVGIPVIASKFPEMGRIVSEFECGFLCDVSLHSLKGAVVMALNADADVMRERSSNAAKVYNWESQESVLLETYESICLQVPLQRSGEKVV